MGAIAKFFGLAVSFYVVGGVIIAAIFIVALRRQPEQATDA
jgi:hypothetical protein